MPPKKRKAAAVAMSKTIAQQPAKKVRMGDTSTIDSDLRANPSASGRPRRATSNDTPQYNFTTKKVSTAAETNHNSLQNDETPAPKRRGRPPKKSADPEKIETGPPRRGNLTKGPASQKAETSPEPASAKKRGRPAKAQVLAKTTPVVYVTSGKNKQGRKPKAKAEEVATADVEEMESETDYTNGATNPVSGDVKIDENVQYWLMKAEPESRMEKGVDVKFSIDDLAARTEPEGWDGVRNPVARNNMRAMRVGDLAFFYHSNCTTPGIVGIMRVVEEHQVDETAFDPNHPYYDPKSIRDKPKWELVKVEFVKKFDTMLTLKELKSFAGTGGMLEKMQTLKQSRLSVSSVQPAEWQFILEQLGERYDLGHVVGDGYESDTDGEAEQDQGGLDDDAGANTSFESDATDDDLNENVRVLSGDREHVLPNGAGNGDHRDVPSPPELPEWPGVGVAETDV